MVISMDILAPGCCGTVTEICLPEHMETRMKDFGMIPGTNVCCKYRSPDGRVTALALRGTVIAMRTQDMRKIRVKVL